MDWIGHSSSFKSPYFWHLSLVPIHSPDTAAGKSLTLKQALGGSSTGRALQVLLSCHLRWDSIEYLGEHGEHGKDGKYQSDDLKHSICDSKHSFCQPSDSKHSSLRRLWRRLKKS